MDVAAQLPSKQRCDNIFKTIFYSIILQQQRQLPKKQKIGDRQCTYNSIVRALTIAEYAINLPALLEVDHKIGKLGGGNFHCVEKSVVVCPIFLRTKKSISRQNQKKVSLKKNEGNKWARPPNGRKMILRHMRV